MSQISVSGLPRLKGGHMTLGLSLNIPVGLGKPRLSKESKQLLEAFLVRAIEKTGQLLRSGAASRRPRQQAHRMLRRASTGF